MRIEHALRRADLDLDAIRERVSQRVGRELGMVASPPADDSPGVLMFEEMGSDQRVAVDPRVVVSVVDEVAREIDQSRARVVEATRHAAAPDHEHVIPQLPTPAAGWLADFDDAADDAERFAVVRAFFAAAAQDEARYHAQVTAEVIAACEDGTAPCTLRHEQTSLVFHGHGHGH